MHRGQLINHNDTDGRDSLDLLTLLLNPVVAVHRLQAEVEEAEVHGHDLDGQ